jgi:hypothetical protein
MELMKSLDIYDQHAQKYKDLLAAILKACAEHGLSYTADIVARAARREVKTYGDLSHELTHLDDLLTSELARESIFRIHPDRKDYYEQDDLFGPAVATAFPSCARDIRKAGSCYALEQEDACVHHLMMVLSAG